MENEIKISAKGVQVFYADTHAIKNVDVEIQDKTVTAFIGPSGCGKSTFLRSLNRMNDTINTCRVEGEILLDGQNIYNPEVDPVQLRAKVGMVFQKPNPFPKSIYDNVAYGPRIHGLSQSKTELDEIVEMALRRGALWEEVKDRYLNQELVCLVVSNKDCALQEQLQPSRKFCLWMSRARRLIQLLQLKLRN